ncbi:protein tyrosine serine phosphatase : Protein serine/threonine/tyrosine phosphatase, putative OS=Pelobacter carbinolicus (strain DSM 2380 / Gra Bd 1) GN=Pcar_2841 PE=4 SV=2: Y_phosphatase2 [Gemmata massiliana]|uniref:Tyrosine specific protein phosphatases domain-containing protein n=1 Tax=Gemmata massiliana TaxID=1210884 RepID=A0A6P2D4A9_9BACT|nr:tyrosine-protein phosphatase [Gemmata massiliana]VTR95265.1 protein tyrosine serine phosphatase : Protein serine/threonine/tyrosine phosphatase, putative OS=Pelobacter carbinolicus (strain DSM 2380 / Gra Bd 1) GN=Pcar_2841 PE=4 SV=2: Y_phosphatase2 [Gemmata massiliana]
MTRRRFLALMAGTTVAGGSLLAWGVEHHTRNFHTVEPGVLYRSGQMTRTGLKLVLGAYHIKTVVTLRTVRNPDRPFPDAWEADVCAARDARHMRIVPRSWSVDKKGELPAERVVKSFLDIVSDPANQPVLVHCFAGIHRTGTMCALFRMARQGWSADQAIAEMQSYGFKPGRSREEIERYLRNYHAENRPAA